MASNRDNIPRPRRREDELISDTLMDQALGQRIRAGGGINLRITIAVISFIGALIFQGGSLVWWCSQQSSRVTSLEVSREAMQTELKADQTSRNDINTHLASIEQNIKDLRDVWFNRPYAPAPPQQVYVPAQLPSGNTIINTAPAAAPTQHPLQSLPNQ